MSIIKTLRETHGLTQVQLADRLSTSQPQIRRLEAGERRLTKEWAERLAPHLGTTAAELMFGDPLPTLANYPSSGPTEMQLARHDPTQAAQDTGGLTTVPANARLGDTLVDLQSKIPVYGQAVGGMDGEFVMNGDRLDDVFSPPSLSSVVGAYAVFVSGESMEPRYFNGEIVYVNPAKRVRRGDFVVAQIQSDEHAPRLAYVKRFVRWNSSELVLAQYNPVRDLRFEASQVVSVHLAVMGGAV